MKNKIDTKYFTFLMVLILINWNAKLLSQSNITIYKPLKVGDSMPQYTLNNLINYPTNTANITDFRGKLLILNFWSTSCTASILSWPKLLKLQEKFDGQIQIILINTSQNKQTVKQIFEKQKKTADVKMTLPTVCGEKIIEELFPHSSLPHVVWIDEKGIVMAITDEGTINSKNIQKVLNKEPVKMRKKTDSYISPIWGEPLFINGNGGTVERVFMQSTITQYPSQLRPFSGIKANPQWDYYASCSDCSIDILYRLAYSNRINHLGNIDVLLPNRLLLEVSDKSKYLSKFNDIPNYDYRYVYHLVSPPTTLKRLQERMQLDLKWFFGLDVKWEKRRMQSLVLTIKDTTLICYKEGERAKGIPVYDAKVNLNKLTVSDFITYLEDYVPFYWGGPYPLIDETNYKGLLGKIEFETNVSDHKALDKALKKYGIRLTLEDRKVDVLVVSEPEEYKFPHTLELTKKQKEEQLRRKALMRIQRAESERDWNDYVKYTKYYVNTYLMNNYVGLRNYAYAFSAVESITNKEALDEAIKWIKRSIELNSNYYNHETYTALLYKLRRKEEALKIAQKTIEVAYRDGWDGKWELPITKLIEKIKALKDN